MVKSNKRNRRISSRRKTRGGSDGETCKFCERLQCKLDKNTSFCANCKMNPDNCTKSGIKSDVLKNLAEPRMNRNLYEMSGMDAALGIFEATIRDLLH